MTITEDPMTTTELSPKNTLYRSIARALMISGFALISTIVCAIIAGIAWQFWAMLGLVLFGLVQAFRYAHKVNKIEDKQKAAEKTDE